MYIPSEKFSFQSGLKIKILKLKPYLMTTLNLKFDHYKFNIRLRRRFGGNDAQSIIILF